jgi:hypothetical protein
MSTCASSAAVQEMKLQKSARSSLRGSAQLIRSEVATSRQQADDIIPTEISRTKPLAQLTAADIPRGMTLEDLATDAEPSNPDLSQ